LDDRWPQCRGLARTAAPDKAAASVAFTFTAAPGVTNAKLFMTDRLG
jgi:hypothetical protein